MERELKIAELAQIWAISVPSVWARVDKEKLITFKKVDESNKNVTYVRIPEEILNKYIKNINNKVNNNVNNGYYEDLLRVENVNNAYNEGAKINEDGSIDAQYAIVKPQELIEFANVLITHDNDNKDTLITIQKDYNKLIEDNNKVHKDEMKEVLENHKNEIKEVLNENKALECENVKLQESKKHLEDKYNMLEEKYNKITEKFEKSNKEKEYIKWAGVIGLIMILIGLLIFFINFNKPVNNVEEQVINDKKPAEVQEVVTPQVPQQAKKVVPIKRK